MSGGGGRSLAVADARQAIKGSPADPAQVEQTLRRIAPDGVVHLAAKKSHTESVADTIRYGRGTLGG